MLDNLSPLSNSTSALLKSPKSEVNVLMVILQSTFPQTGAHL